VGEEMAHCPSEEIKDLEKVFQSIRCLDGIKEKKYGIFYLKSKAFLHFHKKDDDRWADIRCGKQWGPKVNLPFGASKIQKEQFLQTVYKCYKKTFAVK